MKVSGRTEDAAMFEVLRTTQLETVSVYVQGPPAHKHIVKNHNYYQGINYDNIKHSSFLPMFEYINILFKRAHTYTYKAEAEAQPYFLIGLVVLADHDLSFSGTTRPPSGGGPVPRLMPSLTTPRTSATAKYRRREFCAPAAPTLLPRTRPATRRHPEGIN